MLDALIFVSFKQNSISSTRYSLFEINKYAG